MFAIRRRVCVYNLWQPFPLIATDDDDDYVDFDTHQKMRTRAPQSLSLSLWMEWLENKIPKIAESTSTATNVEMCD